MKKILKACTGLLAIMSLATQATAAEALKELGKGEGELSIVAWAGYIERGDTDKNYDWVTEFEKETGCKVSVKTAATSDEMVALMNEGGFDLVTASGDASLRLIAGGGDKVEAAFIHQRDHFVGGGGGLDRDLAA